VFGFLYITATGCAIVLLGLSWRHELHKRHAAEGLAAKSGSALQSAQARLGTLEEQNQELSSRLTAVGGDLREARGHLSRRTVALRDARVIMRSMETFVAILDGLDETIGDTVKAEGAIGRLKTRLSRHLDTLDRYVRSTDPAALKTSALRARLRPLASDLVALQTILAGMTEGKKALDDSVEPLSQTEELDRALKAALTRAKAALRR
jgi:chromosome segregation ATPase